MQLVTGALATQLEATRKGELDLTLVVIDEDAPLVTTAVRDQGLQIAGFAHIDVIARRIPHLRTGRIGAGQYEAVKVLPAQDKRVLRVETVVLGNRCASRSATIDMLNLLTRRFPDFVRHNKETPNTTGLEPSATARGFFERGGPELADEYAPWLVDVMPPANWAYVVMGVSLLFNAMGAGHRFRLWRIDDARVKLESELSPLFGQNVTLGDIANTAPSGKLRREPSQGNARLAHRRAREARGAVAPAVALHARADGPGDGLSLPGGRSSTRPSPFSGISCGAPRRPE